MSAKRIYGDLIIDGVSTFDDDIILGKATTSGASRDLQVNGSDTNVGLNIVTKGTGIVLVPSGYAANVGSEDRALVNRAWTLSVAKTFTAKQTFTTDGTTAALNVAPVAGDVSSPANGDIWYDATSGKFRARQAGTTVDLIGGGSGTVTSVSGTTDRITSSGGTTPVIDIASSYVGQASITTLGTIATGVWNATTIGVTKGGTGLTALGTALQMLRVNAGATALEYFSGTAITDGNKGDITVASSGTSWTINNTAVTFAKIQNVTGLSVVGRSANSSGVSAAITAASDGHILRRSGTSIGFGTIATAGIGANQVTDSTIRQSGALSVIGNASNATANVGDISAGTDGFVLRRSGTALGFGTLNIASIVMNTSRLLGRTTASSGAVEEMQVLYGLTLASGQLYPSYEISIQGSGVTSYTLQATDRNKVIYFTATTTITVTAPDALTTGFGVVLVKGGTGNVVFAPETPPLDAVTDTISIAKSAATFVKKSATVWSGFGSLGTNGGGGLIPENGLNETTPGFVGLGGTLNKNTSISGNSATYSLTLTSFSNFILGGIAEDDTVTKLLAVDSSDRVRYISSDDLLPQEWVFADNSGDFPTAPRKGKQYIAIDNHGNPGDFDFIPAGMWMIASAAGADEFAEYYFK